jgi:hypothetical protein
MQDQRTVTSTEAPADVRLDESTDAGEFLYQNLSRVPVRERAAAAAEVICRDHPAPADLAAVLTRDDLTAVLGGLGEYGLEFASMFERGDFETEDAALAERGVSSAERFAAAALKLRMEQDR